MVILKPTHPCVECCHCSQETVHDDPGFVLEQEASTLGYMTEQVTQSSPLLQQINAVFILKCRVKRNYARSLAGAMESDLSLDLQGQPIKKDFGTHSSTSLPVWT